MNTAKKRILSLTLTICLALSMMLTLSACGKKNLDRRIRIERRRCSESKLGTLYFRCLP